MAKETKRRTFPTKYTESVEIGTFEVFTKPSMTEPDNAMSIPEIIARFTRGYGLDVQQHQWDTGSAFEGEDPEAFFDDFGPAVQQQSQQHQEPVAEPAPDSAPTTKQEGE